MRKKVLPEIQAEYDRLELEKLSRHEPMVFSGKKVIWQNGELKITIPATNYFHASAWIKKHLLKGDGNPAPETANEV